MQAVYHLRISALNCVSTWMLQVSGGVTANMEILTSETYGGSSAESASESERWDHTERPEAANLLALCVQSTVCVAPTAAMQWRADVVLCCVRDPPQICAQLSDALLLCDRYGLATGATPSQVSILCPP